AVGDGDFEAAAGLDRLRAGGLCGVREHDASRGKKRQEWAHESDSARGLAVRVAGVYLCSGDRAALGARRLGGEAAVVVAAPPAQSRSEAAAIGVPEHRGGQARKYDYTHPTYAPLRVTSHT